MFFELVTGLSPNAYIYPMPCPYPMSYSGYNGALLPSPLYGHYGAELGHFPPQRRSHSSQTNEFRRQSPSTSILPARDDLSQLHNYPSSSSDNKERPV